MILKRQSINKTMKPGPMLIIGAVAIVAVLPIVIFGIPHGADLPNHLRFALPFHDALLSGNLHPGWLAESNAGMGDPRFRFYPPGFYYLLSTTRMLTGSWFNGMVAALALLSIIGGIGAYFWARAVCSPRLALWAGILYTLAPYRLNEVYQASLLSEYAACSVLPFAFAFLERICRRRHPADIAGLATAYAVLVLTHLPMAVIGSLALGAYALLRLERPQLISSLTRMTAGVLLGLLASAFFWVTMLAELSWIKGGGSEPNPYYDYRLNFVFSPSALTNRNTWYANLLAFAVIGFLIPGSAIVIRWIRHSRPDRTLIAALTLTLLTLFMSTELSRPVWAIVPRLSEIQFPWRWLSITTLMGALLAAASIPWWKDRFRAGVRPRDLAFGLVFVLALIFTAHQVIYDSEYLRRARFESLAQEVRGAVSFKDWLPIGAQDVVHLERMKNKVEAGERNVSIQSWEPERRQFQVSAGPTTQARIRTYYYAHWVASANGQTLPTSASADGALLISLPADAVDVTLRFQEPRRVHTAELLSLLGWLLIVALFAAPLMRSFVSKPSGYNLPLVNPR